MKIDNATRMSILYDYYGRLLTEKQSRIFTLYHEDNLSLSEIGSELEVSKQGVHDALKKAESSLENFEDKLGLIKNSTRNEKLFIEAKSIIKKIETDEKTDKETKLEIKKIEDNIDKLNI